MTSEHLTALLATRIMGWDVGPDRFLMGNRGWMPRWRFRPLEKLEDAFRLLHGATPQEYSICGDGQGNIRVRVRIDDAPGEAQGRSTASVITYAIAHAVGIEVEP